MSSSNLNFASFKVHFQAFNQQGGQDIYIYLYFLDFKSESDFPHAVGRPFGVLVLSDNDKEKNTMERFLANVLPLVIDTLVDDMHLTPPVDDAFPCQQQRDLKERGFGCPISAFPTFFVAKMPICETRQAG